MSQLLQKMSSLSHPLDEHKRCILGAHTSAAGGSWNALLEGKTIGASGVQLFTASQRQWNAKKLTEADSKKYQSTITETGVHINMSHGSYLVNLGSSKSDLLEKSKTAFKQELERCQTLGINFLAFHPGAATGGTTQQCLDTIVNSLIEMKDIINRGPTHVLIESTAGQGSCVGHSFEQLKYLLEGTAKHDVSIGICLDTCHMFAAGYDIRTEEDFDQTFKKFDEIVGLSNLKAFHVNDSLSPLNSRVDRHAMLGEGHIGWLAFKLLMTDPRTSQVPKYLETPGDLSIWKKEISILRSLADGGPLPTNKPSSKMKTETSSLKKETESKSQTKKRKRTTSEDDLPQTTSKRKPKQPEEDIEDPQLCECSN